MFRFQFALLLACLSFFVMECRKSTPPVPENSAIHDSVNVSGYVNDTITTMIVLRHAEKQLTGSDPDLDSNGFLRAEVLKQLLEKVSINKIYSTPLKRTRQTVAPLAGSKGLITDDYPVDTPYNLLVARFLAENKNKTAVIAGHSNTVPDILKAFTNKTFIYTLPESQFDNLFIVSLPIGGTAKVTHLKYGKNTP